MTLEILHRIGVPTLFRQRRQRALQHHRGRKNHRNTALQTFHLQFLRCFHLSVTAARDCYSLEDDSQHA